MPASMRAREKSLFYSRLQRAERRRSGCDGISSSRERHVAETTLLSCAVRPSAEEIFEGGLRCINNELRRCAAAAAAAHGGGRKAPLPSVYLTCPSRDHRTARTMLSALSKPPEQKS
ncbi:unnamed protein product [Lampetra planeri]